MPRLDAELTDRIDRFCDRVLDVAQALRRARSGTPNVRDQLERAGTSVGANAAEGSDAVSAADFYKCLGTASRELSETRFWLRLTGRRNWLRPARLQPLLDEAEQLGRIFGSMIARTRAALRTPSLDET